jgi:hypothetical protein
VQGIDKLDFAQRTCQICHPRKEEKGKGRGERQGEERRRSPVYPYWTRTRRGRTSKGPTCPWRKRVLQPPEVEVEVEVVQPPEVERPQDREGQQGHQGIGIRRVLSHHHHHHLNHLLSKQDHLNHLNQQQKSVKEKSVKHHLHHHLQKIANGGLPPQS